MPSPAASAAALLAALWLTVSRCGATEPPGTRCDNGKLLLERDLPVDAVYWDCPKFPGPNSYQSLPSIDTVYDPEPARWICMDKPISYSHVVPSSGAYRPVQAESGEYFYCPPQRWLNNLYHGATVLLYHPCAPLRERLVLSALARSCLSDYILTSHPQLNKTRPMVLVSWGRTLEISSVASSDLCHWLKATTATGKKSSTVSQKRKYNLLLTWSAEQHKPKLKEPMRRCCQQIVSSLLTDSRRETFDSRMKERNMKEDGKIRQRRIVPIQITSSMVGPSQHALVEKRTTKTSSAAQPKSQNMNVFATPGLLSNMSTYGSESSLESQTEALQPSARNPDFSKPNQMKDNDVVDVREREVDHKGTQSTTHPHDKSEIIGFNPVPKPQSEFPANPEQHPNPQPDNYLHNGQNCYACDAGEHCKCEPGSGAKDQASVGSNVLLRMRRSDEAVWAAAALGFLLVLLALSVLHTRLYRHWRTMPSLYWHDPRQDYDSVADVIRRRLRLAKRRRKRGRRQECVLLPSSSSSDDSQ